MEKIYDICVFGGCGLDMFYYQKADGSYNSKPDVYAPGSKGANQAVAAARAGAKVVMLSRVGKDEIGDIIIDNLKKNNVETKYIEQEEGLLNDTSNTKISYTDADNDISRTKGAILSFTPEMVHKYKDVILSSKMVVAQFKVAKEVSEELINFCYKNNIPIIITPCNPDRLIINQNNNEELIKKITYITANKKESHIVCDCDDNEACIKMLPNKLIMTLGDEGVCYYNGKEVVKIPAIKCDLPIVDTTGAGDTFCGNLAAFLVKNMSLEDAIEKAQYASRLKLAKETAQAGMPSIKELNQFIKRLMELDD